MKNIHRIHRFGICLVALGLMQALSAGAEANSQQQRKGLHAQPAQSCAALDARGNCIQPRVKRTPRQIQGHEAQPRQQQRRLQRQPRQLQGQPPGPRYQPHVQRQRPSHRNLEPRPADRRHGERRHAEKHRHGETRWARQHGAETPRDAYRRERCQARYGGMRELRPGDSLRKTVCMLGRDFTRRSLHQRYPGHRGYYTMRYDSPRPRIFGYGSGWHHRNISTIWIVFDSNDRIVRFLNTPYDDWHHHHTHDHHGHYVHSHDHGHGYEQGHGNHDRPGRRPGRGSISFSWVWIDW